MVSVKKKNARLVFRIKLKIKFNLEGKDGRGVEFTSNILFLNDANKICSSGTLDMYLKPAKLHKQQLSSVTLDFLVRKHAQHFNFGINRQKPVVQC